MDLERPQPSMNWKVICAKKLNVACAAARTNSARLRLPSPKSATRPRFKMNSEKLAIPRERWRKSATVRQALGLLWLVYCLGNFYTLTNGLMSAMPAARVTPVFVLAWLMDFVYLRGIIASVLWFGGVKRERSFIRLLAVLDAIGGTVVLMRQPFQPRVCFFTLLGFFSVWLLWPARKQKVIAPHV